MKKGKLLIVFSLAMLTIATAGILTDTGKAGKTDSQGEGNCSGCHNNTSNNTGPGSVVIATNIPNDTYVPGQNYQVSVTVSEASRTIFGFGMEALDASNANAGTLVITNATETHLMTPANGRINVVHALNGGAASGSKTFTFDWTAPATDIGYVKFYVGSVAGVADGDPANDNPYTTFKSISSPTVTAVVEPAVRLKGMYPNPVKDKLFLEVICGNPGTRLKVEMFSLAGQLVSEMYDQEIYHDMTLDMGVPASLSNGLYLLKVTSDEGTTTKKVLIQR